MNEALEKLLSRRSIRAYKQEHIKDEELNLILEAGKFAPTGKGAQSTCFVVVKDKAVRDKLSAMNAAVLGSEGDPFYGAPDLIIVFANNNIGTYVEDGACAMANLMNAAHALNIGSCWVHRARQVFDCPEGRALARSWGLTDNFVGIGHCILGYVDGEYPVPKPRKNDFVITVE